MKRNRKIDSWNNNKARNPYSIKPCKTCSTPYNNKYCGSFWTELAGVDYTYINRKADYGGIKKSNNHTL